MNRPVFQGFGGLSLIADTCGDPDNPSVLLLHGAGRSKSSWRQAAQALAAAGRYAISLDLRGHGESAWSSAGRYDLDAFIGDLHAVLQALPSRPVIVAASLGGLVALAALGTAASELSNGLVLVDTPLTLNSAESTRINALMRSHASGFASFKEVEAAAEQLRPGRRALPASFFEDHLRVGDDGRLHWRWDPRFLDGFEVIDVGKRIEAGLGRIRVPTLIVRGGESQVLTREEAQHVRDSIVGAEFVEIAGAGHIFGSEHADDFNAILLEFLERRIPRKPLNYEEGCDTRTLRDALGCFGTGVTVVTSVDDKGAPIGLTANSFTSVSLDPPLLLFCLARKSRNLGAFEKAGKFGVNVLHIGQQPTSNRFASSKDDDRFVGVLWESWNGGAPVLKGSLANFDCETYAVHDGGDHLILIGRVIRAAFEPSRDPLLFFRGRYRRLHFD